MEKRSLRLVWLLAVGSLVLLCVWRLSGLSGAGGCPGPPLPSHLPLNLNLSGGGGSAYPHPYRALPKDDFSRLIDLKDFSFVAGRGRSCNASWPPLVVALVHSAPENAVNRRAIRETWGRHLELFFMLGETDSPGVAAALERESRRHRDIVQGNFVDSYRNLTYKHVMGLKWAAYRCPAAKYVLKTDDDVFVNTPFLLEYLNSELSPLPARRLLLCNVQPASIVKRTYRSKWRVSYSEYPGRWYPKYCTGWTVLYSADVALLLYRRAQEAPYFWIDDVHMTGTLVAGTDLSHTPLGELALLEPEAGRLLDRREAAPDSGRPNTEFLFGLSSPDQFPRLWELVNPPGPTSQPPPPP